MTTNFETDLTTTMFKSGQPFVVSATWTKYGYDPTTIYGILTKHPVELDPLDGLEAADEIYFTCATADVEGAGNQDTLVVGGVTYLVRRAVEDGTGVTRLYLIEQVS